MTQIPTHDESVGIAHHLVVSLLDATRTPTDKSELLEQTASYIEAIAQAERESKRWSNDATLTDFERTVARRDQEILSMAAGLVNDHRRNGLPDKNGSKLLDPDGKATLVPLKVIRD